MEKAALVHKQILKEKKSENVPFLVSVTVTEHCEYSQRSIETRSFLGCYYFTHPNSHS